MNRTVYVLAVAMMAGTGWAQNPDVIDNVRSTMKSVQQKQANDMKPALDAAGMTPQTAKPSPVPSGAAKTPAAAPASSQAKAPALAQKAAPQLIPAKASAAKSPAVANSVAKTAVKPAAKTAVSTAPKTAPKTVAKTALVAKQELKPATKVAAPVPAQSATADSAKKADAAKPEEKKWAMTGKRDPFFSPVVTQANGSGCSTGKKCLDIGQINLRGVVKSESGFIAVVTNNLDKAYFLRENDPVFNGYVVKITGDSVVFQETMQDKLGKPFTREVVKKIFTPAV